MKFITRGEVVDGVGGPLVSNTPYEQLELSVSQANANAGNHKVVG